MFDKPGVDETSSVALQPMRGNKTSIANVANKSVSPEAPAKRVSIIGSTVVFKGQLSSDEEIIIEGTLEGSIVHQSQNVVIGKEGRVNALIHARSVRIEGRVDGEIHGDDLVELAASAQVTGNIFCARIKVEDGAQINGTIQMIL